MIQDLNQIYKESTGLHQETPDTTPVPKKPAPKKEQVSAADAYLNMVNTLPNSMPRAGSSFQFNQPAGDVESYLGDSGIADPAITGQDNALLMGQHQSIGAKLARKAANIVPNIAAGLLDMVGDVGNLAFQWGDNRDYDNLFNQAAAAIRDPTGQTYNRTAHSGVGNTLADPNWWIDNIAGLAEFGASFAIGGAGAAGIMGKITEGAAGLLEAGETGGRLAAAAAQLGTSAFMGYTMSARGGAQVYDMTYNTQLQKLLAEGRSLEEAQQEAHHIAAQSAATTVQLSTAINTALNLGSMAPYFRNGEDTALSILRKEFPQAEGETAQAWAERIKNLDPAKYKAALMPDRGLVHKAIEGTKMGLEMMQLQFGQRTGEELGREGKTEGFLEQFGQLENFFDRTMDKDGALAFAIGAVSGLGIDYLRNDVVPSKYMTKFGSDGQPIQKVDDTGQLRFTDDGQPIFERTLVTPRTYNQFQAVHKFTTLRNAVAEDIHNFSRLQTDYLSSVAKGDPVATDRAKDELFNVTNFKAIHTGMGEGWKDTYNKIGSLSQEDAIKYGYAKDENDQDFRHKASEAVSDLNEYQKIYDELQNRYGTQYEANLGLKDVVDMMFARKADLYRWDKTLKEHERKLSELEAEESKMATIANPDVFNNEVLRYQKEYQAAKGVHDSLTTDLKSLQDAADNNQYDKIKGLIRKYRAVGVTHDDAPTATQDLIRKLTKHAELQNNRIKQAEDAMFESTGYKDWLDKNKDKSFEQYRDEVQKKMQYSESLPIYRSQVEKSRQEYNIANENLADILRERNVPKFVRKYNDWMDRLKKETDEVERTKSAELSARVKDKTMLSKLQKIELNNIAERYRAQRDQAHNEHDRLSADLERLHNEFKQLTFYKNPSQYTITRNLIREKTKELASLSAKVNHYDSLYRQYKTDTATPNNEVKVEEVTKQDEDIQTQPTIEQPIASSSNIEDKSDEELMQEIESASPIAQTFTTPEDEKELEDFNRLMNEPLEVLSQIDSHHTELEQKLDQYTKLFNTLNPQIRPLISDIESKLLNNEIAFNYDLLKNTAIPTDKQASILQALKEYVDAAQNAIGEEQSKLYDKEVAQPQEQAVPEKQTDMVGPELPDSPQIFLSNDQLAFDVSKDTGGLSYSHGGLKVDNALTVANSTLDYNELPPDSNGEYRLVTKPDGINKNTNIDVLKPGRLMPGTNIRFEVDTQYNGPVSITDQLALDDFGQKIYKNEKFEDFIDNKGNIPEDKMLNVPIKIVDSNTGKTIGYVKKYDFITAKYPNTIDYRNIVDIKYDKDGNPIDNISEQVRKLLEVRRAVVNSFNNKSNYITGKTTDKGAGHVILNWQTNLNTEKSKVNLGFARAADPKNSLLPDESLKIAIVDNGNANINKNYQFEKLIITGKKGIELPHGSIIALLPGANGKYMYAPLIGQKLAEGKRRTSVNTVTRAIELYLSYDGTPGPISDEITKLEHNTGHNITQEQGLRNFINQYFTYTQRFKDSDTMVSAGEGNRREQFLFNIWDKVGTQNKGNIKIGWSYSGRPIIEAKLIDGKLNPEFVEALEEGFNNRPRAVVYTDTNRNLKGINSSGTFKDAVYTSSGRWVHKEYPSYNEYVKSFSKTAVYGRNQLADGTYTYVSNPSIPYEAHLSELHTKIEPNNTTSKVEVPEQPSFDHSAVDFFDSLSNNLPMERKAKEIGTAPENSKPLSLETLEEKYNFTPESERNGRTPQEVYDELTSRGHSFLSDGYNPFTRCL